MTYQSDLYLNTLIHQINGLNEPDTLSFLAEELEGKIAFATVFGLEDQVITHIIYSNNIPIEFFTIDTGRLFEETYHVWSRTNRKYNTKIKTYYPLYNNLQEFIEAHGPDAFYESRQLRKECCFIRKTEPLLRALSGKALLITGFRADQLPAGKDIQQLEWDETLRVIKYHPLLHWTTEQVTSFIYNNNIPYNPLHNKGFVNIGCAPCTRAIKPGEDFNAGNWWWEKKSEVEHSNVYA